MKNIRIFIKTFSVFLVVKFSIYLNRRFRNDFSSLLCVMCYVCHGLFCLLVLLGDYVLCLWLILYIFELFYCHKSGSSCSKLMMSLVNVSLKL